LSVGFLAAAAATGETSTRVTVGGSVPSNSGVGGHHPGHPAVDGRVHHRLELRTGNLTEIDPCEPHATPATIVE
jgi:hypothetical protein